MINEAIESPTAFYIYSTQFEKLTVLVKFSLLIY